MPKKVFHPPKSFWKVLLVEIYPPRFDHLLVNVWSKFLQFPHCAYHSSVFHKGCWLALFTILYQEIEESEFRILVLLREKYLTTISILMKKAPKAKG